MSLPTEVFVAPHRIRFFYVEELKDEEGDVIFGQYDPFALHIQILKKMGPTRTAEVILHEVLHAIQDASPFVGGEEEDAVQSLAPAIIRLMQDNPGFFPQLQALANQK